MYSNNLLRTKGHSHNQLIKFLAEIGVGRCSERKRCVDRILFTTYFFFSFLLRQYLTSSHKN